MTRITRLLGGGQYGHGRAALVLSIVAVTGGITLGALMASGCFQGESVAAAPGDTAADVSQALATLEEAVASGRLPAEFAAKIRTKIESGEAQIFTASCTTDGECEISADCLPADCSVSACVEVMASGEGNSVCVMIECDESECASFEAACASGGAQCLPTGGTPVVELVELVELK